MFFFEVLTMLGFITINKTSSYVINYDITQEEWIRIINEVSLEHMTSEEYAVLKSGYKKINSGCLSVLSLLILLRKEN